MYAQLLAYLLKLLSFHQTNILNIFHCVQMVNRRSISCTWRYWSNFSPHCFGSFSADTVEEINSSFSQVFLWRWKDICHYIFYLESEIAPLLSVLNLLIVQGVDTFWQALQVLQTDIAFHRVRLEFQVQLVLGEFFHSAGDISKDMRLTISSNIKSIWYFITSCFGWSCITVKSRLFSYFRFNCYLLSKNKTSLYLQIWKTCFNTIIQPWM